jgi:hypothetical protein
MGCLVMVNKSLAEERAFCEQVYNKWDFVEIIVELYAEGVSWRGCNNLDVEAVKSGMRGMLVTGVGQFNLKTGESIQVLMPPRFPSYGAEKGHPFLWPATQNAIQLDELQKVLTINKNAEQTYNTLVKDICLGLGVPHDLLGTSAAMSEGDSIIWGLATFMGNIKTWRETLMYHLKLSWNDNWVTNGVLTNGQVYQVFKAQGIELKLLREQALSAARSYLNYGTTQTYQELVKRFKD